MIIMLLIQQISTLSAVYVRYQSYKTEGYRTSVDLFIAQYTLYVPTCFIVLNKIVDCVLYRCVLYKRINQSHVLPHSA